MGNVFEQFREKKSLQTFHRINFSVRMTDPLSRPRVLFFGWSFPVAFRLRERIAWVLARLRGCAGSPEQLLFAYALTVLFPKTHLSSIFA